MTPKLSFKHLALGTTLAVAAFAMAAPAGAAPLFTFDPSAVGLGGAAFTADNQILSDFSTITLTPSGSGASFTDRGALDITAFTRSSSPVGALGLNSDYALYYLFNGAGTQDTPTLQPGTLGTFSSLNFSLYGAPITGALTFTNTDTQPTGIGAPTLLATGALISGGVAGDTSGQPAASATLSFTPTAASDGFFSPQPFYNMIFAGFQNLPTQVNNAGGTVTITGGGGSANYLGTPTPPVPEPASLALLGTGLLGLGLVRRRRKAA